ncbi:MAG: putative quinol monooxygenase [Cyanobacteria bacterium P01_D01_bin.6]
MSGQKQTLQQTLQAKLDNPNQPFALLTKLRVKDKAAGDRFEQAMQAVVRESRKEADNITYHVNRDIDDPTLFYLYDRWRSIEAVDAHEQTEHFKAGLVTLKEVIAAPPEATVLQIVDDLNA